MKRILATYLYKDSNPLRNGELQYCYMANMMAGFDEIYFFIDGNESYFDFIGYIDMMHDVLPKTEKLTERKNIHCIKSSSIKKRATFHDIFQCYFYNARHKSEKFLVIANSDIRFDPVQVDNIQRYYESFPAGEQREMQALALSRWDVQPDGSSVLFDRADSQDAWVIYGNPASKLINYVDYCNFPMGVAGCDNRLAYELEQAGYVVKNPSKTMIRIYHHHYSGVRNYLDATNSQPTERIPPPYKLIQPE